MNDKTLIEAKVAALEEIVGEMGDMSKPEEVSSRSVPKSLPTFKLGGKSYRFVIPGFNLGGERVVYASDAVSDQALLKEITENFPSLIEEV